MNHLWYTELTHENMSMQTNEQLEASTNTQQDLTYHKGSDMKHDVHKNKQKTKHRH